MQSCPLVGIAEQLRLAIEVAAAEGLQGVLGGQAMQQVATTNEVVAGLSDTVREIGQVVGMIDDLPTCDALVQSIMHQTHERLKALGTLG